ncbi:MAG: DUF6624 domain-containing protein [Planctomycetota bacterium]
MKRLGICVIGFSTLVPSNAAQSQEIHQPTMAEPALRSELLQRAEKDQAIRKELIAEGAGKPNKEILQRMKSVDESNTRRMRQIVKKHGWPSPRLVGRDGVQAAFLLVQHFEHDFQKEMLPLVKEAYYSGSLAGQSYALLLDRVLVGDGQPQVYGTQAKPIEEWKGNEATLQPIKDEANVDKRRSDVGLPPLSEYRKLLKDFYFPEDDGS